MNEQTQTTHDDLQAAQAAMREVLDDTNAIATADGASLGRMLTHMINMQEAISTSPDRRANVAKRLGDFAATTSRMMTRHPEASPKLSRLSDALLNASRRLQASNRRDGESATS